MERAQLGSLGRRARQRGRGACARTSDGAAARAPRSASPPAACLARAFRCTWLPPLPGAGFRLGSHLPDFTSAVCGPRAGPLSVAQASSSLGPAPKPHLIPLSSRTAEAPSPREGARPAQAPAEQETRGEETLRARGCGLSPARSNGSRNSIRRAPMSAALCPGEWACSAPKTLKKTSCSRQHAGDKSD